MATIRDVAEKAGVSVATVSHVVNGSRRVSPEVKARVLKAIAALKYRRDGIARSLRMSQTRTIGLMISDISNPFFADFVRGIEDAVHARDPNYNLILCNSEEQEDKERRLFDVVLEKRVDGIVIVPAGGNRDYLNDLIGTGLPVVFADRFLPGLDADAVIVDNRDASFRLVTHLIRLGHRRIAALNAHLAATSIRERIEGYRDALEAAGIPFDERLVVTSRSRIEDAVVAGSEVLDLRPAPTAAFCTNNFMTLGLIRALSDRGLRCPEDMAVIGFDDFPWASTFRPRLTVVSQPSYALGQEAANLLFDRLLKKRTGPPVRLTLGTSLIIRESCGAHARVPA